MLTDSWFKCYGQAWGNLCVPAAVAHPAKFSRKLIFRIFEHAIEEGWVKPGDTCIDCFGGVGLGALPAMMNGLHWVGVELEPRFVLLGQGGDCDGTVAIETRLIHIKAEPSCKGWFVRLRAEAKYWGKSCKVCDGGPIGEGFETKQRASAFADELATSKDRWERMAYTIHYYEDEPIAAHDEWQQFVTRPALCGRQEAHEPHHVVGNIELWNKRYAEQMPNWGTAVIVQGDSRRLGEVLARASLCLSSPPYADQMGANRTGTATAKDHFDHSYGQADGQLGNLPDTGFEACLCLGRQAACLPRHRQALAEPVHTVAPKMPPSAAGAPQDAERANHDVLSPAQMPEGSFDLALSSPVYIGNTASDDPDKRGGLYRDPKRRNDKTLTATYSEDAAQLAQMPEGDLALAISSPPWQGADQRGCPESKWQLMQAAARDGKGHSSTHLPPSMGIDYGDEEGQLGAMPPGSHAQALEARAVTGRAELCLSSPPYAATRILGQGEFEPDNCSAIREAGYNPTNPANLGNETGSTFWAASRAILEQVYQVLAPGGHAIWVLKMFVRSGRLVDFPGQWEQLCQSVGFRTVCKHRAWLNKNADIMQTTLDGDEVSMEKWYKSFFRRLAESKGSPRIDWELVLCMEKPIN